MHSALQQFLIALMVSGIALGLVASHERAAGAGVGAVTVTGAASEDLAVVNLALTEPYTVDQRSQPGAITV